MMESDRSAAASGPVRWENHDGVLLVTIDNPPVNALGHAVRVGLMSALDHFEHEDALRSMVLASSGTVFIGGADIREFTTPRREPLLSTVCQRLEDCAKPIVAAMHGAALGGGFEIALAAHYRVAAPAAEVAFPEVLLGLLPGAGGTQRAPRLCGAALALDLMLTGRRVSASDALTAGLLDRVNEDPVADAMRWARELATAGGPPRRARDGTALRDAPVQHRAVAEAREQSARQQPTLTAPPRIIACVAAAIDLPFDDGVVVESTAFRECLASPQRAALVHLFFAEREVRASISAGVDLQAIGAALRAAVTSPRSANDRAASADPWDDDQCDAMAAVGEQLLARGAARLPIDIDVASVRHVGFPRSRGGVLFDRERRREHGPPRESRTT